MQVEPTTAPASASENERSNTDTEDSVLSICECHAVFSKCHPFHNMITMGNITKFNSKKGQLHYQRVTYTMKLI